MLFVRVPFKVRTEQRSLASIDELVAAIDVGSEAVEQAKATVRSSSDSADELTKVFAHVGLEGKATDTETIKTGLDELHSALSGVAEALEQTRVRAESLRGTSGSSGSSPGAGPVARPSSVGPSTTKPSSAPSPDRRPAGSPEAEEGDARKVRGLRRQNEAAILLAKAGYEIQQSPPQRDNGCHPDFIIEGDYFDCYAPTSSNPKNVRSGIRDKVKKQQAARIVLDLNDSDLTAEALRSRLLRDPVHGLQEIKIVEDGAVTDFYPWGEEH